jgi:hypothetical protein
MMGNVGRCQCQRIVHQSSKLMALIEDSQSFCRNWNLWFWSQQDMSKEEEGWWTYWSNLFVLTCFKASCLYSISKIDMQRAAAKISSYSTNIPYNIFMHSHGRRQRQSTKIIDLNNEKVKN